MLGYYLSSHPLAEYQDNAATPTARTKTSQLADGLSHRHRSAVVGRMLAAIKTGPHQKRLARAARKPNTPCGTWKTSKGFSVASCGQKQFAEYGELVVPDAIVGVRGAIDRRPGSEEVNLIVNELMPLDQLPTRFTSGVLIRLQEDVHGLEGLEKLREIVRGYPGTKPLKLRLDLHEGGSVMMDCPNQRVEIDPELRGRVEGLLGAGNFRLIGNAGNGTKRTNGRRGRPTARG